MNAYFFVGFFIGLALFLPLLIVAERKAKQLDATPTNEPFPLE